MSCQRLKDREDGVYQASSFENKPNKQVGFKSQMYFLTEEACLLMIKSKKELKSKIPLSLDLLNKSSPSQKTPKLTPRNSSVKYLKAKRKNHCSHNPSECKCFNDNSSTLLSSPLSSSSSSPSSISSVSPTSSLFSTSPLLLPPIVSSTVEDVLYNDTPDAVENDDMSNVHARQKRRLDSETTEKSMFLHTNLINGTADSIDIITPSDVSSTTFTGTMAGSTEVKYRETMDEKRPKEKLCLHSECTSICIFAQTVEHISQTDKRLFELCCTTAVSLCLGGDPKTKYLFLPLLMQYVKQLQLDANKGSALLQSLCLTEPATKLFINSMTNPFNNENNELLVDAVSFSPYLPNSSLSVNPSSSFCPSTTTDALSLSWPLPITDTSTYTNILATVFPPNIHLKTEDANISNFLV